MMNKILNGFGYVGITVSWLALSVIFYWSFLDRSLPSQVEFVSINSRDFHPGDDVVITYRATVLRECKIHVERWLQSEEKDRENYLIGYLEKQRPSIDIGKTDTAIINFRLGMNVTPGEYVYFSRVSFMCNPMQHVFPIIMETPRVPLTIKE